MFRRQMMAMMVAMLTLFPLTAYADARVTAAGALVDTMISDLEIFLATDTGDESARTAEIDRVLNTYSTWTASPAFLPDNIGAPPAASRNRVRVPVPRGAVRHNRAQFRPASGSAYTATAATAKGDKFVIVSGTFTDTTGQRPAVKVNWRVLTREGAAPVIDIEIENLSLLVTQKQENVAVIRKNKGEFVALINAMKDRLATGP